MIKSTFGITREPFCRTLPELLPQQTDILDILQIHAQHGGFSVILGLPGVGKSVLREHLEALRARDTLIASMTQTLHTYLNILRQLAESLQLSAPAKDLEKEIIKLAFQNAQANKTLYTLIDEAHLLDIDVLRKLRLLFERFPKKHNLILLGQPELMYRLSMTCNDDIKNRITFSRQLLPLNDLDLTQFIHRELDQAGLSPNVFDEASLQLILRNVQGNLRLCRNLCHTSLITACRDQQRGVMPRHVNDVLIQPHWRSHEALIKQQVTRSPV